MNDLDAKILKILLRDGRTGYDEIAKECGTSKNKVWKHCMSMRNQGIIEGATIQVNFGHLGYDALATLLIIVEAQQMEQAMEFIEKISEVHAHRQYFSVYNVRAFAVLRNLSELDNIKQVIKRKLPTMGLRNYIWTGVRNIPENLNVLDNGTTENNQFSLGKPSSFSGEEIVIGQLDNQIIEKLTLDGRASFTQIAKEIGLSTDTVVKRYHKLRKNGTLKASIQINPSKIGYKSMLDFNVAFSTPGSFSDTVVDSLAKIPNITIITKTSGDYDLQVTALIKDVSDIFALQDEISRISGVTKIEVSARKIPDKWPTPLQYISTF
jgi:Lrp/AsnC family transcriptional regulator for asnA, asnC and gidA